MKKAFLFVAVSVLFGSAGLAQSVEEIVAKNLNAIGGVAKLREIKSVELENSIKVQGLEMENLTTIRVGKAMRSDSKIMGNTLIQAYDGTTPWSITPILMGGNGEPQIMPEEAAKSLINQTDPFLLLDYVKKGTRLELSAVEKVNDKEAYHLKVFPKLGAESEIWINVEDGLMSKLKTSANGQEMEVVFSNYIEIDGIKFAMRLETSNPMAGLITVDTKTVKLNNPVDESIFKMPTTKQ